MENQEGQGIKKSSSHSYKLKQPNGMVQSPQKRRESQLINQNNQNPMR
jgi:hypothetical protein